jgi:hypothetical protein
LSALPPGKLDLGATGTPAGFTVTFTAATGSDMYGLNLDGAMRPDGDWRSTSSTNTYVGTTMTWTGSPMTTMTTSANLTYIKRYVADLSSYTQTDEQNGLGAKPAYATASLRWFYAIVDSAALHVREIASDGAPIGNVIDVAGGGPAGVPLGGALGGEGASLYAVWSHNPGTCHWAIVRVGSAISTTDGAVATTCLLPRLAVGSARALAVFDDGAAVQAMVLTPAGGAGGPMVVAPGTAARIVPAVGGGFWLAWQDGAELRVGTYAPARGLADMAMVQVPGGLQTYELVAAGNHTYLFVAANRELLWTKLE